MRRFLTWSIVAVLLLVIGGLGAGGWYYSDQLLPAPVPGDPVFEIEVIGSDPAASTLTFEVAEGDLTELDLVGFQTATSLVVLQGEIDAGPDSVTRTGALITGDWPAAGDLGVVQVSTFAGDPQSTLGLSTEVIDVPGELGGLPAWRVAEPDTETTGTWAVLVHGRGADKDEVNRALTTTSDLGLPGLAIAVRNDSDGPADPNGWGRFGDTEWEDLDAAIDHLRRTEGASSFVLIGYSQGGAIVMNYLRRADDTDDIEAAVLISPLVSMHATLVQEAEARGIPGALIPPLLASAKTITRLRSGMNFSNLEHARDADEFSTPILLTHGDQDVTVPIGPSRELAEARPDIVVYEEYTGVGHVREWNADRARFDDDLRAFLAEHVPAATP